MSGQKFTYALRPSKFVDRALFVELLQYVDRALPIRDAVYVGFGGPGMEDHRAIHAGLGLRRLISLERDENVYEQQRFNRPLREILCLKMSDKDFLDELDVTLYRAKADPNSPRIIWFDYESPSEAIQQLQNLQAMVTTANDGDVIRISMNAHASSLGAHKEGETDAALQARRLQKLADRFAEFAPAAASGVDTTHAGYPAAVLEAIRIAVLRCTADTPDRQFLPLLLTKYSDGQTMVTATGIVLSTESVARFQKQAGLNRWPHFAKSWGHVENIGETPGLTLRERLHLDQLTMTSSNRLPQRLTYLMRLHRATGSEIVRAYRRYQRFIPRFQNVDI